MKLVIGLFLMFGSALALLMVISNEDFRWYQNYEFAVICVITLTIGIITTLLSITKNLN